jgi:hypothetical protein
MAKDRDKQASKKDISPIAAAAIIVSLLILVAYSAYVSGFLPFLKPQSELARALAAAAEKSGGDFNKLDKSEKEYLDKMTSGRGAIAVKGYAMSKKK